MIYFGYVIPEYWCLYIYIFKDLSRFFQNILSVLWCVLCVSLDFETPRSIHLSARRVFGRDRDFEPCLNYNDNIRTCCHLRQHKKEIKIKRIIGIMINLGPALRWSLTHFCKSACKIFKLLSKSSIVLLKAILGDHSRHKAALHARRREAQPCAFSNGEAPLGCASREAPGVHLKSPQLDWVGQVTTANEAGKPDPPNLHKRKNWKKEKKLETLPILFSS